MTSLLPNNIIIPAKLELYGVFRMLCMYLYVRHGTPPYDSNE